MTYKKMNKQDQSIWKDLFSKGNSFKQIEEFFKNRKESPFDFEGMFGDLKKPKKPKK